MIIEPLIPDDIETVFEIEQRAHLVPWTRETLLNCQGERYLNLVIRENRHIIGFAICHYVLDEATLFNLAIEPSRQGEGLGKRLLESVIVQLRKQGILTLWLEVRESNPARHLYETVGFNQVDIRKNYYPTPDGKRENAVVMALYL